MLKRKNSKSKNFRNKDVGSVLEQKGLMQKYWHAQKLAFYQLLFLTWSACGSRPRQKLGKKRIFCESRLIFERITFQGVRIVFLCNIETCWGVIN